MTEVKHSKRSVDIADYQDRPFSLRLAQGEHQMTLNSFDLSVLQTYRDDPRYSFKCTDISGCISVSDNFIESKLMSKGDKVYLQTFGFSYDENFNRAVCVYLIYLSRLSAQHQQIWNGKLLKGNYKPHPDYVRSSRYGLFPEGISVFDAVCEEIFFINEICKLMSRPPLLSFDPKIEGKPDDFSFLIRPTKKELYDFIHTLDKLLSDNINRDFFGNDVSFTREIKRKNGKVLIEQKGTIQILKEWLINYLKVKQDEIIDLITVLKNIRELRQKPAHKIDDNLFDQHYFHNQRELIEDSFVALKSLRHILQKDPRAKGYNIPEYIENCKVWTF